MQGTFNLMVTKADSESDKSKPYDFTLCFEGLNLAESIQKLVA